MNSDSVSNLLQRLWGFTEKKRRWQFGALFLLMNLAAFAEILSIGALLPLLAILTRPDDIYSFAYIEWLLKFHDGSENQLIFIVLVIYGALTLLAGAVRLVLVWSSARLSFAIGVDFGFSIYRRTLYQPYAVHCSRNSSQVINAILSKVNTVIFAIVLPILTLLSSCLILLATTLGLFLINPEVSFFIFLVGGFTYLIIILVARRQLKVNSNLIASNSTDLIKVLQEGLGGIRDILIDGSQEKYCTEFRKYDYSLRMAQCRNLFIGSSPRYIVETFGILMILILIYFISYQPGGIVGALPVLGVLVLGIQKILPLLQQIYSSLTGFLGSQASLKDVVELLEQHLPEKTTSGDDSQITFTESIKFNKVDFRYNSQNELILRDVNLLIKKGERVGFFGSTGGGKSTLLDILMGLLEPTDGHLEIDGVRLNLLNRQAWQQHISHVPQNIFLVDGTLEENIAFSISKNEIDSVRVREVAKLAQISNTIEEWPEQYETIVGERGVRLSGGQRQRIGIARALYKQAKVIILDEATSALDNETEQAVMDAISALDDQVTLLIVAHRLSTLKKCDRIMLVGDASVQPIGTYEDMLTLLEDTHNEK